MNLKLLLVICLGVLAAYASIAFAQTPPTVGRDTTYYLGPLDDEGYVDYRAALEQAFGDHDTTNADNAFVGIFENLDVTGWNAEYVAALRERLNLQPPADDAQLFVGLPDYAIRQGFSKEDADALFAAALEGALDEEQAEFVDRYFVAMEGPLARISNAVQRPNYFTPLLQLPGEVGIVNTLLPHLGPHRMVARTLSVRADRALAADNLDAAIEDLLTLHRLARLQTRESAFISMLVGLSIKALASDSTRSLLRHDQLTIAQVHHLKNGFASLPKARSLGDLFSGGERVFVLDTLQQLDRGHVGLLYAIDVMDNTDGLPEEMPDPRDDPFVKLFQDPRFDQDVTLKRINEFWEQHLLSDGIDPDFFIKHQGESGQEEAMKAISLTREDWQQLMQYGRDGVPADADAEAISRRIGELLLGVFTPNVAAAARTNTRIETMHQLEQIGLALASYQLTEGRYPPLLLSLVPNYLDAVPIDPFTGKPLIYRTKGTGYTLYSVGSDGEDDGGLDDRSSEGDLVLRVGEAEAVAP